MRIPRSWKAELLVIDNGSRDCTGDVLRNFRAVNGIVLRPLLVTERGKCRALNTALAVSEGEVLLFTDDDLRFPTDWLEKMSDPILNGKADLVQGGIRWAPHLIQQFVPEPYLLAAFTSTAHMGKRELEIGLIGANMGFSRKVYESIGNFDENLGPGELGAGEETLYSFQSLAAGFRKLQLLDVEVEHHFDAQRLNRASLLVAAARKGQSNAYIDYHYRHVTPNDAAVRFLSYALKDYVRSVCTPAAWEKSNALIPAWKYSYVASKAYHRQMMIEATKPRKTVFPLVIPASLPSAC